MEAFMTFMAPYWTSVGVFIIFYAALGYFEELIGLKGIMKAIIAIIIAVLFYHFWDNIVDKFTAWLQFLGLEQAGKK